ncbi:MAG: tRNA methyl transferase PRC-barrel domain-containing protein [Rikenellaceae bacterium]
MVTKRVLLAFSGGIDSCAAIGLLRAQGYTPVAMTIDMLGDEQLIRQASESAERLGVELHIVDGRERFSQLVIANFIDEYRSGRTPAPCTRCNPAIKWQLLIERADELGIYYLASGHYFNVEQRDGRFYVLRGDDPRKDQSYYLWGLSQEVLARVVTPMGQQIKESIRRDSFVERESMGICFLRGMHYGEFIRSHIGEPIEGDIICNGDVVGRHNGIYNYTIGQRRGVGIPAGGRVVELIAESNQIRVGDNSELFTDTLVVGECNFVDELEVMSSDEVSVMIRGIGLNPEGFAEVVINGDRATVRLSSPAWAAAEGQPVVFYIKNRVVGGGYLVRSFDSSL